MCALELVHKYQGLDLTEHMNARLAKLVQRGIYDGGLLSPVAGTLTCTRTPFMAIGYDGVTVRDVAASTKSYTAGETGYHVVLAKYNPLGSPTTPTLDEYVIEASAYAAHPDRNYMIVLAVVTLGGGVTEVTAADISYALRDTTGPLGRVFFKGIVATASALPTPAAPTTNKIGDCYLVQANWGLYTWKGTVWDLVSAKGASTLDGAYDDNSTAPPPAPGSGRWITADAGAVEINQASLSQHGQDLANAALRLNKELSTTDGTIALDIVQGTANVSGAIMVREAVSNEGSLLASETISIASGFGGPVAFSRVGVSLYSILWGGAGSMLQLIEITGSVLGNNGLFHFQVLSDISGSIRHLNNAAAGTVAESGLTAKLYCVRTLIGGQINAVRFTPLATGRATSYELLSTAGGLATKVGKVYAFRTGSVSSVMEFWRYDAPGANRLSYLTPDGSWVTRNEVGHAYEGETLASTAAISGVNLCPSIYAGPPFPVGVEGISDNDGGMGVFGVTDFPTAGGGVYGATTGTGIGTAGASILGDGVWGGSGAGAAASGVKGEGLVPTGVGVEGVSGDGGTAVLATATGTDCAAFAASAVGSGARGVYAHVEGANAFGFVANQWGTAPRENGFAQAFNQPVMTWVANTRAQPEIVGGAVTWRMAHSDECSWVNSSTASHFLVWEIDDFPEGAEFVSAVLDWQPADGLTTMTFNVLRVTRDLPLVNSINFNRVMGTEAVAGAAARDLVVVVGTADNTNLSHGNFTGATYADKIRVLIHSETMSDTVYGLCINYLVRGVSHLLGPKTTP